MNFLKYNTEFTGFKPFNGLYSLVVADLLSEEDFTKFLNMAERYGIPITNFGGGVFDIDVDELLESKSVLPTTRFVERVLDLATIQAGMLA